MSSPTKVSHLVSITTYYLEMLDRSELKPKRWKGDDFQVVKVGEPCPEYNRFLYCAVGWPWAWIDKLGWTHDEWKKYVDNPTLETWVGYFQGTPAGYFELEKDSDANVKIVYFGLTPQFTGRGLGGPLLTAAIERGWEMGARRVWVHTCTLDHPVALSNYKARGLRVYDQETHEKYIPVTRERNWP